MLEGRCEDEIRLDGASLGTYGLGNRGWEDSVWLAPWVVAGGGWGQLLSSVLRGARCHRALGWLSLSTCTSFTALA